MFDRIKKAFLRDVTVAGTAAAAAAATATSSTAAIDGPVSEWAAAQGFTFSSQGSAQKFSIQGKVRGKLWRMELGHSSRNYISGEELRGRAELGIKEKVAVMVMSRSLKERLEKQAYSKYTDSLQTEGDPDLPEELRWLAMFEEVGWDGLPNEFWTRYSVLTDRRDNATEWLAPSLVFQLLKWPAPGPVATAPFILMLMRGKAYLRMQYQPADVATLQHATEIFTHACELAIDKLTKASP